MRPAQGVRQNIFPDLVQFILIADDMFVIGEMVSGTCEKIGFAVVGVSCFQ
jgi:hypothetical protein